MDSRYLIVAGAFLTQAVIIGCMFSYGVYFNELETEFGWSRTYLSAATSLGFLSMGLMASRVGQISDRYGPTRVIAVGAVCTTVAYVLLSFLQQPWQLFVIYATLIGVGLAVHDIVTLSTVARWFPRRRGIMSGVVKVGTACGQMLVPMLAVYLIAQVGWRSSLVWIGIGAGVVLVAAALLMGVQPAVQGIRSGVKPQLSGTSFVMAKRDRTLWLLCAVQLFSFSSLTTITTHIVPHAIDGGLSSSSAAGLLTLIAGSSVFGRLLVGVSFDRLGGKSTYLLCLALLTGSVLFLFFITNPVYLYLFAIVYGFTHGGLFTVVSPTVAERFGLIEHGRIFGLIIFFGTIGGAVMPIVTGWLFDRHNSYSLAFLILAAMALCSLVLASRLPSRTAIADTSQVSS
ncbi:MAG: MFS transporter [Pseudomonadota bacterium]